MRLDATAGRRRALRHVVSGVAVLTAWHGSDAHGTTVSAVTAVSREPLLAAVCLRRGSTMAALAGRSGRFAINVLHAGQAELAGWFADPRRPAGLAQFDQLEWETDVYSGSPLLVGSLAAMGCRLADVATAGDHDVLIAEVVTGTVGSGTPLLSFDGRLHDNALRRLAKGRGHPAAVLPSI